MGRGLVGILTCLLEYGTLSPEGPREVPGVAYISFENVTKGFSGRKVLENCSFSIEAGEIVGFLGRNGSGKSVIFKLLCGLMRPDSGRIALEGRDLTAEGAFLPGAGVLIESPGFLPGYSAMKNLSVLNALRPQPLPRVALEKALRDAGLDPADRRPVRQYSLGMRQKLGIAQALAGEPPILLLDEPTANLDQESAEALRTLLRRRAAEGATVLVATHLKEDAQLLCTRILRVENGGAT